MKKGRFFFFIGFVFFAIQAGAQTTFNFTGAQQTYAVPNNVCVVSVDVRGAEGSDGEATYASSAGGMGGKVLADIPVTPGEDLYIYVGGKTNSPTGGWNGGGTAGSSGGGGGGASDIRRGGTTFSDRVVVAGGGGGGGYFATNQSLHGGDGGGLTGGDAVGSGGGEGGSQLGGGAGGGPANDGSFGNGGDGEDMFSGGGGGGYYGGGGGGESGSGSGYGGGGGSSYTDPAATNVIHTQGAQTGNGQVTITPVLGMPTPAALYGDTLGCLGDTALYSVEPVKGADSYHWQLPSGLTFCAGCSGRVSGSVGMAENSNINSSSGTSSGLIFEVKDSCRLDSVAVYPKDPGTVAVRLLDNTGTVLQTTTVDVSPSSSFERVVIPVGFELTPGSDYELDADGTTTWLRFNSSGVSYPYTMPEGWVVITEDAENGTSRYSFLYDWHLSVPAKSEPFASVVTYDSVMTGTMEVSAVNQCGDTSVPVTAELTVVDPSATDAGTDTTICVGDSTLLHVSSSKAINYAWSPGASLSHPDSTTTWAFPEVTTNYTVTVTYNDVCMAMDDVTVRVSPVADAGADATMCPGDSVRLQAGGGENYAWNPAAGLSDTTTADPWAAPSDTTTYSVLVTDSIGCTATDSMTVFVVLTVLADAGEDVAICTGDSVRLGASGGTGYLWSPGVGLSDTSVAEPWAAPSDTTQYIVTVSSGSCMPASDTVTVNVAPLPSTPSVSPTDTTICRNNYAFLTVTDSASFDQIIWYAAPAGGNGLDTANTLTTPPLTTTTTYYVAGENEFGYRTLPVGPADNSIASGGGYGGSLGLIFDVMEDCRLEEVAVYPQSSGTVGIRLEDDGGNVLQTTTVSVTVSSAYERVVIPVGFDLSPGTDYRLLNDNSTMALFGNNTGASYPYTMPEGWVSITDASNNNSSQYYHFYDWKVGQAEGTCASTRASATVTVSPVADAGTDAWICTGDSTQLQAAGGDSYAWSPTTGLSDPAIADPWASPSDTTTYTVAVTDSISCTDEDSVTVFVTNELQATAEADTTICAGESAPLMATGGTGYDWSPAAGLSCTNCQSPIAAPAATTTYVATVSSGACTPATDTVTVTVQAPPADAGADRSVCEGDSVQLSAGGGESYAWSPATGLSNPAAANPWAASPEEAITYTVTVTDTNGCTATDATTVTTLLPPEAGFDFNITGYTVDFTDTSAHADSYDWDFGDENTSTEASPPDHTYEAPDDYEVCLTVSNTCGSDTHCETIVISSVPGSLSEQPSVRVYPNPAGAYVTVEVTGIAASKAFELHMYSMEGKQVNPPVEITREQQQARAQVDVSGLAEGFYLLRVVGESYTLNEKVYVVE